MKGSKRGEKTNLNHNFVSFPYQNNQHQFTQAKERHAISSATPFTLLMADFFFHQTNNSIKQSIDRNHESDMIFAVFHRDHA
jgi:hypothetical protein